MKTSVLPFIVKIIVRNTGLYRRYFHFTKIKYKAIIPDKKYPEATKTGGSIYSSLSFIKIKIATININLEITFNIVEYFILSKPKKNHAGKSICPGTYKKVNNIIT